MTHYCLCLFDKEDQAKEMDKKLQHHSQDGVQVEDVGQGTLFREGSQGLCK